MGEMREWWTNVYPVAAKDQHAVPYRFYAGQESFTRAEAQRVGDRCAQYGVRPAFRLHVRLKPEGAPRRYASDAERRCWEIFPKTLQGLNPAAYAATVIMWGELWSRAPKVAEASHG